MHAANALRSHYLLDDHISSAQDHDHFAWAIKKCNIWPGDASNGACRLCNRPVDEGQGSRHGGPKIPLPLARSDPRNQLLKVQPGGEDLE